MKRQVYAQAVAAPPIDATQTDDDLMRALAAGQHDALGPLYSRYASLVFSLGLQSLDRTAAEELVQEVFLAIWRGAASFDPTQGPFRPWLLTIVANEARNRQRSTGRRDALALRAAEEIRPGDAAPSPEAALLSAERRAELLAALNRLPERDRLVLACRYLLDLSEEETAAALACRRGTVKSRLARALERLRGDLGETDG